MPEIRLHQPSQRIRLYGEVIVQQPEHVCARRQRALRRQLSTARITEIRLGTNDLYIRERLSNLTH